MEKMILGVLQESHENFVQGCSGKTHNMWAVREKQKAPELEHRTENIELAEVIAAGAKSPKHRSDFGVQVN